ncbi:MAG: cytochrome c oxidase assembly protein [Microbacteriaceae bacterium]
MTQNQPPRSLLLFSAAVLSAVATVVLAAWITGLTDPLALSDPGVVVRWGLPVLRVLTDLSMAVALGASAFAAFALSDKSQSLTNALNLVAGAAIGWTVIGSANYLFTYLSITGSKLSFDATFSAGLELFLTQIALGQALALNLLAGLVVATLAIMVRSLRSTIWLVAAGFAGLVPLAVSGHAAGSAGHAMAVNSIGMHLVGVVIWVGGLVALLVIARGESQEQQLKLLKRFSTLALAAFVLTATSGVAAALIRLSPSDWFTTNYGRLVLAKIVALLVLGALGAIYRLRLIGSQPRGLMWRVASLELVVMSIAVGLAAALARTGAPVDNNVVANPSPARILTGTDLPPELTLSRWITEWRFDLLWSAICLAAAVAYVWGVIRLRRRGDNWSIARTASWLAGLAMLFYITNGAINAYQEYLFSVHMIGHMILSMGVPVLLVPGAPVTLLLRAVAKRNDESQGVREWVLWAVHTPWARLVSHPIFAAVNFAASLVLFYFTPAFSWSVHDHLGHQWMTVHFLITGYLFVQAIIGIDPGPHRLPYPVRLMLLIGTLAFHAFFGLALMDGTALLLPEWYGAMGRTWGSTPLADQHDGGAIAWGIGELPTAVLTIIVSVQWARADQRESTRLDRASDRTGNQDLEEYNAMLARLAKREER